jgi:ribosomal-protein-serine acetyltransferase
MSAAPELRPLSESDVAELYALVDANRAHLAPWMPWAASQTHDGTLAFIRQSIEQEDRDDGFQRALIVDGEIAGVIGFHRIDRDSRSTTIGYWLAERFQGCGLMTAAVRELVSHAIGEWALHRVELRVAPNNARSRALAERLGFRAEGRLREAERFADDDFRDLVVYSLLAGEWA